jgi:acyl-CoA thioester hydrolase
MNRFTQVITAQDADIDILGHVNNAVWVRWIQDLAGAHWEAVAPPDQQAAYVWVVTRHEIDYRGNLAAGESVTAETWVASPRGARVKVEAVTTWALIDRATGRLLRVRPEIAERFLSDTSGT